MPGRIELLLALINPSTNHFCVGLHRLVHEFAPHAAPIAALAVHPTEFLMASACADRTVRVWDLEKFEQISCTPPDGSQVRRILFSDNGSTLLSGAEDSLKVWGWEPVRCYEHADVRWSRLADLCMAPGQQLLAASFKESMLSVWSLQPPSANACGQAAPSPQSSPSRSSHAVASSGCRITSEVASSTTPTSARQPTMPTSARQPKATAVRNADQSHGVLPAARAALAQAAFGCVYVSQQASTCPGPLCFQAI